MTYQKLFLVTLLFAPAIFAADDPVERWAKAVGGREKVAAIESIYREATLQVGHYSGSIKAWHTSDGRYRKEEQIATLSSVETFDALTGAVQQGAAPPSTSSGPELARARSTALGRSNSVFFAFF